MVDDKKCEFCPFSVPASECVCPHCGNPSLFPNVRCARADSERNALGRRYSLAIERAGRRDCLPRLQEFEAAVESEASIVLSRRLYELERLMYSENEVAERYYKALEAGTRIPSNQKWDRFRPVAEEGLFVGYKDEINFAALSLDEKGVLTYGQCALSLRDDCAAHRTSLYHANNVVLAEEEGLNHPAGYRAPWEGRRLLAVAKLESEFGPDTSAADFPSILMKQGVDSRSDEFVEVHLFGRITIRTVRSIHVTRSDGRPTEARLKRWKQKLMDEYSVGLEWS